MKKITCMISQIDNKEDQFKLFYLEIKNIFLDSAKKSGGKGCV